MCPECVSTSRGDEGNSQSDNIEKLHGRLWINRKDEYWSRSYLKNMKINIQSYSTSPYISAHSTCLGLYDDQHVSSAMTHRHNLKFGEVRWALATVGGLISWSSGYRSLFTGSPYIFYMIEITWTLAFLCIWHRSSPAVESVQMIITFCIPVLCVHSLEQVCVGQKPASTLQHFMICETFLDAFWNWNSLQNQMGGFSATVWKALKIQGSA